MTFLNLNFNACSMIAVTDTTVIMFLRHACEVKVTSLVLSDG